MKRSIDVIRLAEAEPLVLAVSALTDFLWPDFVREAKPRVNYFSDQYDIRQLSRFGKELFEFLYTGGDVNLLVSMEDIEKYLQEKQDGSNPALPKGYKPENVLWQNILIGLATSPIYSSVYENCLGKHFESGNTAVCILNEIADVIGEMIEEDKSVQKALTVMASDLQQMRKDFTDAIKAGDNQKASQLRQQGKELGQRIEDILSNANDKYKSEIQDSIEQGHKEAGDIQEAMNAMAGNHEGFGVKLNDVKQKQELAKRLQTNRRLMELAKRLGGMKQAWAQRIRAKKHNSSFSDIVGAKMSDDVTKAFPSEIALAATEEGKALFAYKHSQKTILSKDFEASVKELSKGPVVMYVDISGSMAGDSELWSKAISYVIAEQCSKEHREIQIHLFDTGVNQSIVLEPRSGDHEGLLNFLMAWYTRGGTSFDQVMIHASVRADIDPRADILIITDGECQVTDLTVRRFNAFKDNNKIDVFGFCIGKKSESLLRFCDSVHLVDICEDAESSDLFQKAIK
jgi:uncharacterized protein with von Willebrand factor type A (vWA) domain